MYKYNVISYSVGAIHTQAENEIENVRDFSIYHYVE